MIRRRPMCSALCSGETCSAPPVQEDGYCSKGEGCKFGHSTLGLNLSREVGLGRVWV